MWLCILYPAVRDVNVFFFLKKINFFVFLSFFVSVSDRFKNYRFLIVFKTIVFKWSENETKNDGKTKTCIPCIPCIRCIPCIPVSPVSPVSLYPLNLLYPLYPLYPCIPCIPCILYPCMVLYLDNIDVTGPIFNRRRGS